MTPIFMEAVLKNLANDYHYSFLLRRRRGPFCEGGKAIGAEYVVSPVGILEYVRTNSMIEHSRHLLPWDLFVRRFLKYLLFSISLAGMGLGFGILGYRLFAGFTWVDAFMNAAMILTGMGPVGQLTTTSAKLFASIYALFSGLIFLTASSVIIAPIFHRLLHKFHLEGLEKDE